MKEQEKQRIIEELKDLGNWFNKLPKENKLDMSMPYSNLKYSNICNTPACFGGFIGLYYDLPFKKDLHIGYKKQGRARDFGDAARFFADFFGENYLFIIKNQEIWGDGTCYDLFSSAKAFKEGKKNLTDENITTKDIAKKLLAVADRLSKHKLKK